MSNNAQSAHRNKCLPATTHSTRPEQVQFGTHASPCLWWLYSTERGICIVFPGFRFAKGMQLEINAFFVYFFAFFSHVQLGIVRSTR